MRPPENADFLMLDLLRSVFPEKSVAYHMPATFKLSWSLRGSMETFLMDYILNPELVHGLACLVLRFIYFTQKTSEIIVPCIITDSWIVRKN